MARTLAEEKIRLVKKTLKKSGVSNLLRLSKETGIDSRTVWLILQQARALGWDIDVFPERSFTVIWKGDSKVLMKGHTAKSHSTAYKMGLSGRKTAYAHKG